MAAENHVEPLLLGEMVHRMGTLSGDVQVQALLGGLKRLVRRAAGNYSRGFHEFLSEGQAGGPVRRAAEQEGLHLGKPHGPGEPALDADVDALVGPERDGFHKAQGAGDPRVVADLRMHVQRKMRRVEGEVVIQKVFQPGPVGTGDPQVLPPEETVMDEKELRPPGGREAEAVHAGVHGECDPADLLLGAAGLNAVQGRVDLHHIVDAKERAEITVQFAQQHGSIIRLRPGGGKGPAARGFLDTSRGRSYYGVIMRKNSRELRIEDILFGISEEEIAALDTGSSGESLIIGQERAVRALTMGMSIRAKGYNLIVTGLPGTGKRTTILEILEKHRSDTSRCRDIAFVYNFERPENPRVLYFAAGGGRSFKKDMHRLVENLKILVPAKLAGDAFTEKRDRVVKALESEENRRLAEFEGAVAARGFKIVQIGDAEEQASDLLPLYKGEATSFEDLQKRVGSGEITEKYWNDTREKYYRHMDELKALFMELRRRRVKMEEELQVLRVEAVEADLRHEIGRLKREYPAEKVGDYLLRAEADIKANLFLFTDEAAAKDSSGGPALIRYGVNVIVDAADMASAPVIFESRPDYAALFGSQESAVDMAGETRTNFMMIRAGALVRASGGFLILRAEDILNEEDAWNSLKRALEDGRTEIRNPPNPFFAQVPALKPEQVEIDTKVIIMGGEHVYDFLYNSDEDFPKLFKVPAEFDSVMDRNGKSTREYIDFIRKISGEEKLLAFDSSGIAAVVEYGVRVGEFRSKLTTRFSLIADLIREADHWARLSGKKLVGRDSIRRALEERKFLHNLPEEKIDEQILSGEILMALSGSLVGRTNGLAILDRGYYAFGRPLVITARTAPGHDGVINIERESGLSGEIHDKGVLIIEGYLQAMYARDFPLSIRATICLEQSYIEVDGDSASSAEIYALLSAVSDVPLRQDIAVTGSVNQMGDIQPVGGVSEKIEGFFEVCRKTGLTGTQGVVIPRLNLPNLILSAETQEAVRNGSFHLYAVSTVDEGLEILTGIPAGVRGSRGAFPPRSMNGRVQRRLREMALQVKDFGGN